MTNRSLCVIIRRLLWAIGLTAMFFQCYIPRLSSLIVPAILGYVFVNIYTVRQEPTKDWLKLFSVYVLFITISSAVTVLMDGSIGNVLRFATILLFIPFVYLEQIDDFDVDWMIFKWIIGVKALSVVIIWFIVLIQQDYTAWRQWAYSLGVGDIYILSGIPRVQLQGNSLLLFAGLVDYEKKDGLTIYNLLMIISVLCSGNSAFYLGLFIYFAIRLVRRIFIMASSNNRNGILWVTVLSLFAVAFFIYGVKQLEMKSSGLEDTNKVRIEQAQLLLDANPLLGDGVGSYANGKISTRVYVDATYFELQALYIIHQIGLIGMGLFLILTFWPLMHNKKSVLIYFVYLVYTFWNPYCFDSTHIIVLIILANIFLKVKDFESNNRISNSLLSE